MSTECEWLDAELPGGVCRVELIAGTNHHTRPSSREFLSMAGFIVTGVRLTSYEALYYSDGPHAGKLCESAEYQELAAVRGLMDAHVWYPSELLGYVEHHGVEAHFPAWIYVPPRQTFWWQTRQSAKRDPELGLSLEFSWERPSLSDVEVLCGRSRHHDAVLALERRRERPYEARALAAVLAEVLSALPETEELAPLHAELTSIKKSYEFLDLPEERQRRWRQAAQALQDALGHRSEPWVHQVLAIFTGSPRA